MHSLPLIDELFSPSIVESWEDSRSSMWVVARFPRIIERGVGFRSLQTVPFQKTKKIAAPGRIKFPQFLYGNSGRVWTIEVLSLGGRHGIG